jgi:hypothetical protein
MEEFIRGGAFLIESISPQELFAPEEFSKKLVQRGEIMGYFFHHIYRKFYRERYTRIFALLESEVKETEQRDLNSGDYSDQSYYSERHR